MPIPDTSVTLLKDLAREADNVRWSDFVARYESPMRAFLQTRFPSVDADDILQETLLALMRALPDYRYAPDERGHFRNYLMGVLKHKATDALRRYAREAAKREGLSRLSSQANRMNNLPLPDADRSNEADERAWQDALMHAALDQLMLCEKITPRDRQVFLALVRQHEPPADVAARFGLTRGNVDVIKCRLLAKLVEIVKAMKAAQESA